VFKGAFPLENLPACPLEEHRRAAKVPRENFAQTKSLK